MANKPIFDFRALSNIGRTWAAQAGIDRSYRKVFAIGYNKTGTSSIDAIFAGSGLHSMHSPQWSRKDGAKHLFAHQAFSDGDGSIFADLDRRFPRSKFILNVRDLIDWLDSRLEHIHHTTANGRHIDSGFWQATDTGVTHWITERNRHHLAVLDYFRDRPDELLVVNFVRDADAADRICRFIGVQALAEKPFRRPTSRRRDVGKIANAAMIHRCLQALQIPDTEWRLDLFCPSLEPPQGRSRWPADSSRLASALRG